MSTNCPFPDFSPKRGPARRFPRAEHFDTFAELLAATRKEHWLTIEDVAILTNTKVGMVTRFESGRSLPHMLFLRSFRDALGLPLAWLDHCLDQFTWSNASDDLRNSQAEKEFVSMAATPIGSRMEKQWLDRLWLRYDYIPKAVARRLVFKASDREDFAQDAQFALRDALLKHLPYLGNFQGYAWRSCEGTIRGRLSDEYYGEMPEVVRKRHAKVLKVIKSYRAEHGCNPTAPYLVAATELTLAEVMESMQFHHRRQREISFDDPLGDSGRTYGDLI